MATTRHEEAHIWFFNAFPRITLCASSRIGAPGKGISRFIEPHGNMAEHTGHIGKAISGAMFKDTPWQFIGIDGAYVAGAGVGGYYAWNWFNRKQ